MRLGLFVGALLAEIALAVPARDPSQSAKLAGDLRFVAAMAEAGRPLTTESRAMPFIRVDGAGRIRVVVRCHRWSDGVERSLRGRGLEVDHASERWSTAVGWAAPEALRLLANLPEVSVIHPPYGCLTGVGSVTSQADEVMGAAAARQMFGVDGSGLSVGILSNSFSLSPAVGGTVDAQGVLTGSNPQSTGDLPPTVLILDNGPLEDLISSPVSDEGAAMGELIHDLAPGSPLLFHTAFRSQVDFAEGILELAAAGSDVIVDDVLWLGEPMFQNGPIAQAVEEVVGMGIPHFSSAGNQRDHGLLSAFVDADATVNTEGEPDREAPTGVDFHEWVPGGGPFARIEMPNLARVLVVLQWAEPFAAPLGAGAEADLDLYLFNGASLSTDIVAQSIDIQGTVGSPEGDAIEALLFERELEPERDHFLAINHVRGRRDSLPFRVVIFTFSGLFGFRPDPDPAIFGDMQIYGHAAATGAMAVAAVDYLESETGGALIAPPGRIDVQTFSALGGELPFYFDGAGAPLPAAPMLRFKPDLAATDAVNPPFFGFDSINDADQFPNFFGTSAAAPHAAAVAALVLERAGQLGISLTPGQLAEVFARVAQDIGDPGRDFRSGWGFLDALGAVSFVVPAADEGAIIDFLLGLAPRPTDADLNGDGEVDSADLLRRVALPY
jgi:subtilisin family serine protease